LAIYYCQMSVVSRSTGRSAVAAAAYRSASILVNERDGRVHDYERRAGVEHSEIVLPDGVMADWALDRSALWNAAELAEKRSDARVAREFVVALPSELSVEGRQALTRDFAQELSNRYGGAVDFAIHAPHPMGDVRNHHAHVLMTTRQVTQDGLGAKTYLELANKDLLRQGLASTQTQLVDLRRSWEGLANERLALEGFDIRIDHRSHAERGLEIEPTEHVGVTATNMQRRGGQIDRARMDEDAGHRNAELIREKPEQVLSIITNEKSVFDRYDVARALHRYINDDVEAYGRAFASVMASPALVALQGERVNGQTGEVELARYSTREMVDVETGMIDAARRMHEARGYGVERQNVERAIGAQDAAILRSAGVSDARRASVGLSDEQRSAIEHITGPERIAAVVGFAGAGKSTMLAAAREAWERQGYVVHGAALSGKAAEGLEESSGIQSRTLASWDMSWQNDKRQLGRGDVFVVDEAGMVGSRQLARFVGEAEARGAKIVLVGDHEQLQAIGAGAPFRAVAEEIGHAELSEIRRQRVDWQREASVAFATHNTAEGLAAYRDHGDIHFADSRDAARAEIVRDYLADRDQRPDGSRVAMAHRRADVRAINEDIRAELQARGELAKVEEPTVLGELDPPSRGGAGEPVNGRSSGDEQPQAFVYQTNDGKREFAPGDRIVFLENNRDLGVKNGMLGTVFAVEPDAIQVELDGKMRATGEARSLNVPVNDYQSFDHGYATTIHKNQGATVDRAFVLASGTMDRHLTYVAMTRHRDGVQLYAEAGEFSHSGLGRQGGGQAGQHVGQLVEHGAAPYEHNRENKDSYFVTLKDAKGERRTTWGVDLERAMREARVAIGATIGLRHEGSEMVRLPDGTEAQRNAWSVQDASALAYGRLEDRLSRSGVKETTLDYTRDFAERGFAERQSAEQQFAERRGIAEAFGIRSEIDVERLDRAVARDLSPPHYGADGERVRAETDRSETAVRAVGGYRAAAEISGERQSAGDGAQLSPEPGDESGPKSAVKQRRSMFDGLKLSARSGASLERGEASRVQRPEIAERAGREPDRDRLIERSRRQSPFEVAVDRYARAFATCDKQLDQGLPLLEGQRQAFQQASQQLEQARPGSSELAASALRHDPQMGHVITALSGQERARHLIAGMERERAALADPNTRADRFVQSWQDLQAERNELRGFQQAQARGKVEEQMQGLAKSLDRDPQVEAILRNRGQELGIKTNQRHNERVSEELQLSLKPGGDRDVGLER
jgi:Ti-type conjugative transfer relaxase TraA